MRDDWFDKNPPKPVTQNKNHAVYDCRTDRRQIPGLFSFASTSSRPEKLPSSGGNHEGDMDRLQTMMRR